MLTTPFASMRKVTEIFGTPRGAGGMPVSSSARGSGCPPPSGVRPGGCGSERSSGCPRTVKISLRSVGIVVLRDEDGEDTTARLDAERERRDVEQGASRRATRLSAEPWRGAGGDDLVRVDALCSAPG